MSTARAVNAAGGWHGRVPTHGREHVPVWGQGQGVSAPHHPLPLSLSRGDQCLTNNSTYFEVAAGDATLVKHGEWWWRAQPLGF